MNSLTRTSNVDLSKINPHELNVTTKKDMLFLVYRTLLDAMGQSSREQVMKQLIDKMPERDIDLEWKAITNGTVTKALKVFMSGKMDAEDMHGLAALFEGIAKPYFTEYHGEVPEDDMKWAHKEIKEFFDKVATKQDLLPGNNRLSLKARVEAKYTMSLKSRVEAKYAVVADDFLGKVVADLKTELIAHDKKLANKEPNMFRLGHYLQAVADFEMQAKKTGSVKNALLQVFEHRKGVFDLPPVRKVAKAHGLV